MTTVRSTSTYRKRPITSGPPTYLSRSCEPSLALTSATQAFAMASTGSFFGMNEMARIVSAALPSAGQTSASIKARTCFEARMKMPRNWNPGGIYGRSENLKNLSLRASSARQDAGQPHDVASPGVAFDQCGRKRIGSRRRIEMRCIGVKLAPDQIAIDRSKPDRRGCFSVASNDPDRAVKPGAQSFVHVAFDPRSQLPHIIAAQCSFA